jgi:cytochrome P450
MPVMQPDLREACSALFRLERDAVRWPYSTLDQLREQAPVAWFDEIEAYVVTRYDLIAEVLRDPELYSSRRTTGPITDRQIRAAMQGLVAESPEIRAMMERRARHGTSPVLVRADPPHHTRQRGLVNRAFNPAAIRALERDIGDLAEELLDAMDVDAPVEIVTAYAGPLPMTVIARALGVELDRMADFKRWSDGVVSGVGRPELTQDDMATVVRARSELEEYLLDVMARREAEPRDDLISSIVHARLDGERLTTHEALDMIVQFLVAGNETTAKVITATVLTLALDPALADSLRADPDLIPALVEELLRLEPPSTGNYRITTAECELGGVHLPKGAALWVVYAGGNRDHRSFESPDELIVGRTAKPNHLAFGMGPHYCLGAGLARAEIRIAIGALLRRCSRIELAVDLDEVEYEDSYMVHGIKALPVQLSR